MNDDWKKRCRKKFGYADKKQSQDMIFVSGRVLESFIQQEKEKSFEEGKREGAKDLADTIVDDINEFGEDPKQALSCVSETIDMWFMTPEQQKIHNEGHDY